MDDLGGRFNADGKCKAHSETVCPSCLTYTVRDLQAELAVLSEAAMDADLYCWGPACDREKAPAVAHRLRLLSQPNRDRSNAAWVLLDKLRTCRRAERERILKTVVEFPEYDSRRNGFSDLIHREYLLDAIRALPNE